MIELFDKLKNMKNDRRSIK